MAVTFRAMVPSDLPRLVLQDSQIGRLGVHAPVHDESHGRELVSAGPAWAAEAGDGSILCLAGFAEVFPKAQAIAWALIGQSVPLAAHVEIRDFMREQLARQPYRRLEAVARLVSLAECNWLRRLGFEREGVMAAWGPLGEDHVLFRYGGAIPGCAQPSTEGAR